MALRHLSSCSTSNRGPCLPERHACSTARGRRRARSVMVRALLEVDPAHLVEQLSTVAQHAPLAYEPVALPCSLMNCGDVVHRRCASSAECSSTLALPCRNCGSGCSVHIMTQHAIHLLQHARSGAAQGGGWARLEAVCPAGVSGDIHVPDTRWGFKPGTGSLLAAGGLESLAACQ